MEEELLRLITGLQARGERAALVTIVETRGSTPRKAGTKMLVRPDGSIYGTIGGGCVEAQIRRAALQALDANQPAIYSVSLQNDEAAREGMVCGGTMEVFISPL